MLQLKKISSAHIKQSSNTILRIPQVNTKTNLISKIKTYKQHCHMKTSDKFTSLEQLFLPQHPTNKLLQMVEELPRGFQNAR